VVHELAHIPHKNHGAQFYRLVASVLPDYRARIQMMKDSDCSYTDEH
jgi:predicted metal-dependent hydrolase